MIKICINIFPNNFVNITKSVRMFQKLVFPLSVLSCALGLSDEGYENLYKTSSQNVERYSTF
jgi:hypothetical protein